MEDTKIQINNMELLAPVSAAILLNTLELKRLIALQKGEEFDAVNAMENIVKAWKVATANLSPNQKNLKTSD